MRLIIDFIVSAIIIFALCWLMSAADKRDEFLHSVRQQEVAAVKVRETQELQAWRELDARSRYLTSFDLIVSPNK